MYGEGVLKRTAKTFRKCANELSEMVTNGDQVEYEVWTVPVPYFATRYINHPRYFPGDISMEAERLNKAIKNIVQFLQSGSSS